MKKVLLTIATLIYFLGSSGMATEVHYCMGERVGEDLGFEKSSECGRCGMTEKKGGCCEDEVQFHQIKDDHLPGAVHYAYELSAIAVSPYHCNQTIEFCSVANAPVVCPNPPPDTGPDLQELFCIYRI